MKHLSLTQMVMLLKVCVCVCVCVRLCMCVRVSVCAAEPYVHKCVSSNSNKCAFLLQLYC